MHSTGKTDTSNPSTLHSTSLAVQKVGSHKKFQCDFRCDGELRDFRGAVSVAHFIGEVHADFLKYM